MDKWDFCPKCGASTTEQGEATEPKPIPTRIASLGEHVVRIPTGIDTLDDAMRGGLPTGRRLVFISPPSAGKTGLAVQVCHKALLAGVYVGILSEDETGDAILSRLGQLFGIDRDALEERDPDNPGPNDEARAELARRLEGLHLYLFDGDDDPHPTIESASEYLRAQANGAPSLLVVDSVQTARSEARGDADGPRGRVDGVMAGLKIASRRHGHAVIATCESGRAGYRSKSPQDQASAISQGKESSSIEYGADVLCTFRPVKGSAVQTDVDVPKCRVGRKGVAFRLEWSALQCAFSEVEGEDDDPDTAAVAKFEAIERKVLDAVRRTPKLTSATAIWKASKCRKTDVLAIVRDMVNDGRLVLVNGNFMVGGSNDT